MTCKTQNGKLISVIGLFLFLGQQEVLAEGVFDFADPCKNAEQEFSSQSEALRSAADATIDKWERTTEPTEELRSHYVEAYKTAAYNAWEKDPVVTALLKQLSLTRPDFDSRVFFLEEVYPEVVTMGDEEKAIVALFTIDKDSIILPRLRTQRANLISTTAEQRGSLSDACKPDVVSQVFRATLGNAAIVIDRNLEAAKDEDGDIAKIVRATSGISITDIEKHGVLGGENSELRKLVDTVAGGDNSELRRTLRTFDATLNPARWEIDTTTKVNVGSSNGNPPKIEITVGDTRVCIPWC